MTLSSRANSTAQLVLSDQPANDIDSRHIESKASRERRRPVAIALTDHEIAALH